MAYSRNICELNVSPRPALRDRQDIGRAHAKLFRESAGTAQRMKRNVALSNVGDVRLRQFGRSVISTASRSRLRHGILHIGATRTFENVAEVETISNIAGVAGIADRPAPMREPERKAMDSNLRTFEVDDCVSMLSRRVRPEQAFVRGVVLYRCGQPSKTRAHKTVFKDDITLSTVNTINALSSKRSGKSYLAAARRHFTARPSVRILDPL